MLCTELADKVAELSDLELALLLCLSAHEHCLIRTEEDALDSLQQELQLVRLDPGPFSSFAELLDRLQRMSSAALIAALSAAAAQASMTLP